MSNQSPGQLKPPRTASEEASGPPATLEDALCTLSECDLPDPGSSSAREGPEDQGGEVAMGGSSTAALGPSLLRAPGTSLGNGV